MKTKTPKTPIEKSLVSVIELQGATVMVIDGDRLDREILKDAIADSDVRKLLPFQTRVGSGDTKFHIVNASAYTVPTGVHVIYEGETLCKRSGRPPFGPGYTSQFVEANCPGCLAKAKSIIARHLLATEPELN